MRTTRSWLICCDTNGDEGHKQHERGGAVMLEEAEGLACEHCKKWLGSHEGSTAVVLVLEGGKPDGKALLFCGQEHGEAWAASIGGRFLGWVTAAWLPLLESCEGCQKKFPPARLCSNERTRRLECVSCYEAWRAEVSCAGETKEAVPAR